jgi:hypothetical protein
LAWKGTCARRTGVSAYRNRKYEKAPFGDGNNTKGGRV